MEGDSQPSIRILLVDDKPFIRDGLAAMLNRQEDMLVIAEAENGIEGIQQYRRHQPTVALMDVSMPIMDGIAATRAIVKEFPTARILILSTDPDLEECGLQAGAAAFLLKDMSRLKLVDVIHAICASGAASNITAEKLVEQPTI